MKRPKRRKTDQKYELTGRFLTSYIEEAFLGVGRGVIAQGDNNKTKGINVSPSALSNWMNGQKRLASGLSNVARGVCQSVRFQGQFDEEEFKSSVAYLQKIDEGIALPNGNIPKLALRFLESTPDSSRSSLASISQADDVREERSRILDGARLVLYRFFPRRLGKLVERHSPFSMDEDKEGGRRRVSVLRHDDYREAVLAERSRGWERIPVAAEDVLVRLMTVGGNGRIAVVVGEPGAGKTRLLEAWAAQALLAGDGSDVRVARVRMSRLNWDGEPGPGIRQALTKAAGMDVLGEIQAPPPPAKSGEVLWLLDGLDEYRGEPSVKDLFRALAGLPGRVVVSCRSAVWHGVIARHVEGEFVDRDSFFEMLPLEISGRTDERVEFLTAYFGRARGHEREKFVAEDRESATDLVRRIDSSAQMRELSGTPLLLELIARVGTEFRLPESRAEFYQRAVDFLWDNPDREIPSGLRTIFMIEKRDHLLEIVSAHLALDSGKPIGADISLSEFTTLLEKHSGKRKAEAWGNAFHASGVLTTNRTHRICTFMHPTFREFYLAKFWLRKYGFKRSLKTYWMNVYAEETLGLAVAIAATQDRAAVDDALTEFVSSHIDRHTVDKEYLWSIERSTMRTVLHIVRRSGVDWRALSKLDAWFRMQLLASPLLQRAVANDALIPVGMLYSLLESKIESVWGAIVKHPLLPLDVARDCANSEFATIRQLLASNPNIGSSLLKVLARDNVPGVRFSVAGNSATTGSVLTLLAVDKEWRVRRRVASNLNTPLHVLLRLGRDLNEEVRASAAANNSTPVVVTELLAIDRCYKVRAAVGRNRFATEEILVRLSYDKNSEVRAAVALNQCLDRTVLLRLGNDTMKSVRAAVGKNPISPRELLVNLCHDDDHKVRGAIAGNPNLCEECSELLMKDDVNEVVLSLVKNVSAPIDVIAYLANDTVDEIRAEVARNRYIDANTLNMLANDPSPEVRSGCLFNENLPTSILELLSRDDDKDVRSRVAQNKYTPIPVLERLAREGEKAIRKSISENISSPSYLLAQLVSGDSFSYDQALFDNHANIEPSMEEILRSIDGIVGEHSRCTFNPNMLLEDLVLFNRILDRRDFGSSE